MSIGQRLFQSHESFKTLSQGPIQNPPRHSLQIVNPPAGFFCIPVSKATAGSESLGEVYVSSVRSQVDINLVNTTCLQPLNGKSA